MHYLYELLKQIFLAVTGSLMLVNPGTTSDTSVNLITPTSTVIASPMSTTLTAITENEGLPFRAHSFTKIMSMKGVEFSTVVVDTEKTREQGLSGTKSIGSNQAMLFVFDTPGKYAFWMKDMNYAIDMIWLDATGRVVHIAKNTAPESFPKSFKPAKDSTMVVEVKAGTADRLNLAEGDQVSMSSK